MAQNKMNNFHLPQENINSIDLLVVYLRILPDHS